MKQLALRLSFLVFVLLHPSRQDPVSDYLKSFKAKRVLQQDIIKTLSSKTEVKQGEMLKLLYEAMYGVLKPAFANLESGGFTPSSPFPHDQPHHLDSLSLIYENCALFSELCLRFPDVTDSLYRTISLVDFTDVIKKSITFCLGREEVFNRENEHGKLLNLAMQELRLKPRDSNYINPYRKTLSQTPEPKPVKKKEKKKNPRGPYISKPRAEL